jgi:hypothetical protein
MAWSCNAHRAYIPDLSGDRETELCFSMNLGDRECFDNNQTPLNIAFRLCAIEQIKMKSSMAYDEV